jgi:hypothetical protein
MIFATGLILDREPLRWAQVPGELIDWVQTAGAFASLGIFLWLLVRLLQREKTPFSSGRVHPLITLAVSLSWLGYAFLFLLWLGNWMGLRRVGEWLYGDGSGTVSLGGVVYLISGGLALLVVVAPIVYDLFFRMRWGRIWAIARLSVKEAVRNRAVLVFAAMALVFLFADWFVPYKAEDQVRNYVRVVYWSMIPLFLLTAGLLGAFSIPNDVKSQSIHTIVTKPVQKYEIVLGRFVGYAVLLTAGLAVISGLSLLYVVQGVNVINETAAQESYKARVPVFGLLGFHGSKGDSVGREWDYRRYIMGPKRYQQEQQVQYAYWHFTEIPTDLGQRTEPIKFEYTFDIFRLSKGKEGMAIPCTFTFMDGKIDIAKVTAMSEEVNKEFQKIEKDAKLKRDAEMRSATTPEKQEKVAEDFKKRLDEGKLELAKRHHFYQLSGVPVVDYHTLAVEVPPQFLQTLIETYKPEPHPEGITPMLQVAVNVDRLDESQMLGVAPRDLYLLAAEKPFWQNFLKGVLGMWCTFILVLGIAIACSTYLSGVIAWFCTMFLFCAGMFTTYLQQLASGRLYGGGAAEAAYRLALNRPIGAPIDQSPAASLLRGFDAFFAWWVQRFLNLVPNVNRYDLHSYVANGFDIGWSQVLLVDNLLPLVGYLLPWGILAYYLMKYREIANPS